MVQRKGSELLEKAQIMIVYVLCYFRAISKFICLDSHILVVQLHGKLCCQRQKIHFTPSRIRMQNKIVVFSTVTSFSLCLYQQIKLCQLPFPIGSLLKGNLVQSHGNKPYTACISMHGPLPLQVQASCLSLIPSGEGSLQRRQEEKG